MKFNSSVVSYPDRGHWGDSRYRGNCTGAIVRDFFGTYHTRKDGLAFDPSIGGGTSVDVANELGIRFKGTDLHQGTNLLLDDMRTYHEKRPTPVGGMHPMLQCWSTAGRSGGSQTNGT